MGSSTKKTRREVSDMTSSSINFADISSDLLPLISKNLNVIELLSFRGVCKSWRSISFASSSSVSIAAPYPWLLLYRPNCSKFFLLNTSEDKRYTNLISELKDSYIIASRLGWILARKTSSNSVFFFYPFTCVRIDLPKIRIKDESDLVGAFSSSPTNQDCIVCLDTELELYVIRRGETDWTVLKQTETDMSLEKYRDMIFFNRDAIISDGIARDWLKSWNPILMDTLSKCETLMNGEKEEVGERGSELNQVIVIPVEPRFFDISGGTLHW